MTDVLGHDCDGKELRAGDSAVAAAIVAPGLEHAQNKVLSILGPDPKWRINFAEVEFEGSNRSDQRRYAADCRLLRRLDDDLPDWNEIAKRGLPEHEGEGVLA